MASVALPRPTQCAGWAKKVARSVPFLCHWCRASADVGDSQLLPGRWGGGWTGGSASPRVPGRLAGPGRNEGREKEERARQRAVKGAAPSGLRAVDVSVLSCILNAPLWLFR